MNELDIDFCIETMYELLVEESLPEEMCLRLLAYYDEIKASGQQTINVTVRI